jgi:RNA polymerase sigma-54 factor
MPIVQLEQQVRQEVEQNPMLEEVHGDDQAVHDAAPEPVDEPTDFAEDKDYDYQESLDGSLDDYTASKQIEDQGDPFEFYKLAWQDNDDFSLKGKNYQQEDDQEPFQIKSGTSLIEDLISQLRLQPLSEEEFILGEQIIGSIDTDGYLRRNLQEIIDETNVLIDDINIDKLHKEILIKKKNEAVPEYDNPARQYDVSDMLEDLIKLKSRLNVSSDHESELNNEKLVGKEISYLKMVDLNVAEKILYQIQSLDPPGIASRNVKECLLAQCHSVIDPSPVQKLACDIITKAYEPFTMKHYNVIMKQFDIDEPILREALDVIKRLNPKPGTGDQTLELNTVIPDFIVESEEEGDDLIISLNDSRVPSLRLNKVYEKLKKEARYKHYNKDTREWIRSKYEDAKFIIQAIRQRRSTMLKVMTAIAGLQKDFFLKGASFLRPLIYKDVSDNTGLDISTVCRIVNGKYVQTEFGTYELKYFFSESLPNDDGEEISTTVIKQIIREIIDEEPKDKPYSDDKIASILNKKGYNIARRTVAKYRELLKIPVARLRKEL